MRLAAVVSTPEVAPVPPVALFTGSFKERLRKAAALGYQGIELMCADPTRLHEGSLWQQLKGLNLEVPAIGTGALFLNEGLTLLHAQPEARAEAARRARRLVNLAAPLGAMVTIGSFRGRLSAMGGGDAGRQALAEALGSLADYALAQGVRLALEPLNRYEADALNTAAETLSFIQALGRENVGLLLDTFHANIEEPIIAEAVHLAGERLWHVHLGDSNREPPGRGHFDFAGFVAALRAIGYDGYLSAELLARPDPDMAARLTYEYMRPLL
ncbi:MAG: TIM barrel protein [Anaerolineae bacterium]